MNIDKFNDFVNKYKVINKKELSNIKEKYLGIKTIEYTLANGNKKICECMTKANRPGNAIGIIPVLENGNLLMIAESRPNVDNGVLIEFPAGMIDENESSYEAAIRELEEETGYTSNNIELLETHYQDQGCSSSIITTFLANNCKKVTNQNLDEDEIILPIELSIDEINELINNNEYIKDANTKIAYYTYINKIRTRK